MPSPRGSIEEQARRALEKKIRRIEVAGAGWVRATTEKCRKAVVKNWPGTNRAVHIYAKDKSKNEWVSRQISPLRWEIFNTARKKKGGKYVGYVELGYTRKGKGKAEPWKSRGRLHYAGDAVSLIMVASIPDLRRRIRRADGRP